MDSMDWWDELSLFSEGGARWTGPVSLFGPGEDWKYGHDDDEDEDEGEDESDAPAAPPDLGQLLLDFIYGATPSSANAFPALFLEMMRSYDEDASE